jgi:hypothetical protein
MKKLFLLALFFPLYLVSSDVNISDDVEESLEELIEDDSIDRSSSELSGFYGEIAGGVAQIFTYIREKDDDESLIEPLEVVSLGYEEEDGDRHQLFYMFLNDSEYEEPIHSFGYEHIMVINLIKSYSIIPFLKVGAEYGFQSFSDKEKKKYDTEKDSLEFYGLSIGGGSYFPVADNMEILFSVQYNYRIWDKATYKTIETYTTSKDNELGVVKLGFVYKF